MLNVEKNHDRFLILVLVILVRVCNALIWASAAPLLPLIMKEFSVSRGTVSWYVSFVPLVMASLSVPAGIIGTRLGTKKMLAIGAFLQAGALATPFCTNYFQLFLTRAMFGVGVAIIIPTAAAIAADWFTARELPMVQGLNMSVVSLGNAVSFIATAAIATAFSWRAPITIYGAFAFICATLWLIWGKERQKPASAHDPSGERMPGMNLRAVLRQRATLIFALSLFGPFCLGSAASSWLPTYYHQAFGMSLAKASSTASVFTITGAITCFIAGILSMRIGLRKPFLIFPGLFFGISALSCIMFNHPVIIFISVALFGVFSSLQAPVIFTIPMELPGVTPRTGVVVLAMALSVGHIGSFMGPIIVGYLADLTGSYIPGFLICSVLSLSLFFGGLLIPETGPKAKKVAPVKLSQAV